MPNVELTQYASWTNTLGKDDQIGSEASVSLAFVSQVVDRTLLVPTATAQLLYDSTADPAEFVVAFFVGGYDTTVAWEGAVAADNSGEVVDAGRVKCWSTNLTPAYAATGVLRAAGAVTGGVNYVKKVYGYQTSGVGHLMRFVAFK